MLIAGGTGTTPFSRTLLASPGAPHPRRTYGKPCTVCNACKPRTVLPNGLEVCYASKYDVSFLYREIFEEQTYLQHGIHLTEGDVVVDVGGNIGFFALFTAAIVGASGTVITAEPIPPLYERLRHNIISHKAWSSSQGEATCEMRLVAHLGSSVMVVCLMRTNICAAKVYTVPVVSLHLYLLQEWLQQTLLLCLWVLALGRRRQRNLHSFLLQQVCLHAKFCIVCANCVDLRHAKAELLIWSSSCCTT